MKEEYFKWYSPSLSMEIEMATYGHAGYPVIIFPSTMGRYYESKDFGLIESVRWFVERGIIQIFCPDSIDKYSWYNKAIHPELRVKNHIWYDQMVLNEIVHRVRHHSPSGKVAVAGCSFGGFHACNFAFRHPNVVSHLFSMSGAFDIKSFLDGYYDDDVYFNNPMDFVSGLSNYDLGHMSIVLGTSEWDICLDANQKMSHLLHSRQIPHWYDMRGWQSHDWPMWREMFPHYISLM